MLIDIKKITDICVKLRIDIRQFYFLYLISVRDYTTMRYYVSNIDGFPVEFIEALEKKGLLLDTCSYSKDSDYDSKTGKKKIDMNTLYTTPTYDEVLLTYGVNVDLADTYDELLDVYPYEIVGGNGVLYPARTGTAEKNSALYVKHLLKYPKDHERIIAAVKYGKENGLIKWGIEKFIENKYWGLLIEAMEGNRRQTEGGETMYGNNEF